MSAMPSCNPDRPPDLGRRGFLAVASRALLWLTGGLSAIAISRYLAYAPPTAASTLVRLDKPEAYPAEGMTTVAAGGAALYRDSGGFFARSLTCGHLGCRVREDEAGGFTCPCHGSRYARRGDRVQGPATGDLRGVALSLDGDGRLVLDLATSVEAAWRLTLPTAAHSHVPETTAMNRGQS